MRGINDITKGTIAKRMRRPLGQKEYWKTFVKSRITLCICSKFALPRTKLKFE